MANEPSIRGYRIIGDRPKDRSLSYDYLKQSHTAAKLLTVLRSEAVKQGANCLGNPEKWTGEELPTDREAQLACASCPVIQQCEQYREAAHPAWGNWAGVVKGRNLQKAMQEGESA